VLADSDKPTEDKPEPALEFEEGVPKEKETGLLHWFLKYATDQNCTEVHART
jgi:hypothetical protein